MSVLLLAAVLASTTGAQASGSAPALSLTGADAFGSSNGVRSIVVSGSFNFDDRLQFGFPVGLIVFQGDRFVRYDISGTILSGVSAAVTDGIDVTEIPDLIASGTQAAAPATLPQLRPDRITIVLPPEFAAGTAGVLLYAQMDQDSFVSNALSVVLP